MDTYNLTNLCMHTIIKSLERVEKDSEFRRFEVSSIDWLQSIGDQVWYGEVDWVPCMEISEYALDDSEVLDELANTFPQDQIVELHKIKDRFPSFNF